MTSRREFVALAGSSAAAMLFQARRPLGHSGGLALRAPHANGFLDIVRPPDAVVVQLATDSRALRRTPDGSWTDAGGIAVSMTPVAHALHLALRSPAAAITRMYLRWHGDLSPVRLITGDAWERAYGDLAWHTWTPDAAMPWYFATQTDSATHVYGVRTGANALCYWQVDDEGIALCADVRSGGVPLQLGERTLDVCDVICREGHGNESAFAAMHAFCAQMCRDPRLPKEPVYGSNDWYWAYGNNSADSVRGDAQRILEVAPAGGNRPFVVIDDGWQPGRGADKSRAGYWDRGNEKFSDMQALAAELHRGGVRPGIWLRPLQAAADSPDAWRLSRARTVLDPTVPDVAQKIAADVSRIRDWGFDLIKHDYSTFDLMGRWGNQMGTALTRDGWTFASGPGRTTAEIINEFYATIRAAAGQSLIIGCNTVNHLAAGHFEICRIGDDTSGTDWSRTRKMGVNSLAFRGVQHGAFFAADADCVGVTTSVPWSETHEWLELLSRSGTTTFVSIAPDALGAQQRTDLRAALAIAARPRTLGQPLDWQRTTMPREWQFADGRASFDWLGPSGAGLPGA